MRLTNYDLRYAMKIEDIAAEMGVSRCTAWNLLQSALGKLRRNPRSMAVLLAAAKQQQEQRERYKGRPC